MFSKNSNTEQKTGFFALSQPQSSSLVLIKSLNQLFHKDYSLCLILYGLSVQKCLTFPDTVEASGCQALNER